MNSKIEIGSLATFSRHYKPSRIKAIFKTRAVTESGIRINLEDLSVIDGKSGAWKILATISEPKYTKTWTWAAIGLFSNYFQSYEIGQEFKTDKDLLRSPQKGDIIRVIEFNFARFKARKEKQLTAEYFATGREMVLECTEKEMDVVDCSWGVPKITRRGAATFKILSKAVSDSFNPKSLY